MILRLRKRRDPPGHGEAGENLVLTHTPEAISERLERGPSQSYLRDFVYGSIDGAVTTFAIVAGVAGAALSPGIVVVLGIVNLIADGFSMAISNYLGIRAEDLQRQRARSTEREHIARFPEGEREEIRQIFAAKGFEGDDLERVVEVITSDEVEWVNTMLREEHGLSLVGPSPWKAALTTFLAFFIIGGIPLLPYMAKLTVSSDEFDPFPWSAYSTGVAFFLVGTLKSRFIEASWIRAGCTTLLVGTLAASLAYASGYLLRGLNLE